ncbi:MAG: 50S ribosomal protein L35 [Planctomycetes bacterium]|nr:50S ribosomal protein L35 [Planctomycetota bacterium]
MPKPKPKKSLLKRIKVSAGGKLMRHMPGAGHLKSRKSSARLRKFRKAGPISKSFTYQAKKLMGIE